jgi:hypothetical protein
MQTMRSAFLLAALAAATIAQRPAGELEAKSGPVKITV